MMRRSPVSKPAASRRLSGMFRSHSPSSTATSTVTIANWRGSSMAIKVLKPALSTTVQDLGRPGYYHIGIPLSGGMDRHALAAANLLVGNAEGAAVLEAVFMGPELEFTDDAMVAVTGAELPPELDGVPCETWASFKVKRGQKLSFDFLKKGARAYIAVAGGIDVPVVLGSRSTYALGALGGFKGRKLEAGDELPVGAATTAVKEGRTVGEELRGLPMAMPTGLRVMPGLYWHRINDAAGRGFFSDTWKVAPDADRIGYRFKGGKPLEFVPREPPFGAGSDPSNITDACYPYGSIRVPGGTEPIVLHRDAVSGGGYFMVGTVISADMDLIGQLQPNTPVRFIKVEMDQALAARKVRAELLAKTRSSLKSTPRIPGRIFGARRNMNPGPWRRYPVDSVYGKFLFKLALINL